MVTQFRYGYSRYKPHGASRDSPVTGYTCTIVTVPSNQTNFVHSFTPSFIHSISRATQLQYSMMST